MINADKFKNVLQVLDFFKEESTCKEYLEQQRWNGKVCCPFCNHDKVYRTNRGFKCASPTCYKKFTVTIGTPFENTKIKLRFWFAAMYLISAHKKGISSHQLARDLGICQKSAWFMNHRIRQMFVQHAPEKLTGIVEVDETHVHGEGKNKHANKKKYDRYGNQVREKTSVLGMLQRDGKVITQVIPYRKSRVIMPLLWNNISRNATVMTDDFRAYTHLNRYFANHGSVNHSAKEYVNGMAHTNGIENFWSHLKRGIDGIYHQVSIKHLNRYCIEYAYRFNTRQLNNQERFHCLLTNVNGNRLRYQDLIAA